MSDELDRERLGKIIGLAKHGIGGEKTNAIRIVKNICKKHGLDYKEMMDESEPEKLFEYTIPYKNEEELEVIIQIYCRYAQVKYKLPLKSNKYSKTMIFQTTKEKYIEFLNAVSVLKPLYWKERKVMIEAIKFAFYDKHFLYYTPTAKEKTAYFKKNQEQSKENEKAREAGASLSRHMDDATIMKQLKGK